MNRIDGVNSTNSELYEYDEMDQVNNFRRGEFSESWNYDETGNWLQYVKNDVIENREHNAANEIQDVVAHDANGNMVEMPGMACVYDAWNRLVSVNENIRYEYNGLNQQVKKIVDNVATKSFFNEQWQELECFKEPDAQQSGASGLTTTTTYVWGLRYVDDLISRERNGEKLYSIADPNWNVVAVCNESGEVQERFHYDAFGQVHGLTSDWNRTFTGQVLDSETGLMLYRNRYYHVELGRFVQRDPIGYEAGDSNVYRYVLNAPKIDTDSLGLSGEKLDMFLSEVISFLGQGFGGSKQCYNIPGPVIGLFQIVGSICGSLDISRCCINGRHKICTVLHVEGSVGGYLTGSRGLPGGANPPLRNWKKPITTSKFPPKKLTDVGKIPNVPFRHGFRNACPPEGSSGEFCVTASGGFVGWSVGAKRCYNLTTGSKRTEVGMGVGQGTGISGGLAYTNTSCFWG